MKCEVCSTKHNLMGHPITSEAICRQCFDYEAMAPRVGIYDTDDPMNAYR